jgi:hypothetical protein
VDFEFDSTVGEFGGFSGVSWEAKGKSGISNVGK